MLAEQIAAGLIARWEGFRSRPYLCPAGVPTIGFGFTVYPDGRRVTLTDPPMALGDARRMLAWFITNRYVPAVFKLCPTIDTPERLGAIVDFCFNLGAGNLKASTLRKRILASQWADVPTELRKWVRGGGRTLPGLVARREAEISYL